MPLILIVVGMFLGYDEELRYNFTFCSSSESSDWVGVQGSEEQTKAWEIGWSISLAVRPT